MFLGFQGGKAFIEGPGVLHFLKKFCIESSWYGIYVPPFHYMIVTLFKFHIILFLVKKKKKLLFPLIQLENAVCEFVSLKLSRFSLWIWGMGIILAYSIVRFHTWKGNPEEFLLPITNFCESCLTHWWSVSTFNFQEVTEPSGKMEWTRAYFQLYF